MSAERFNSVKDFKRALRRSAANGEKRSFLDDSNEFLNTHVRWVVKQKPVQPDDCPTLYAVNHFIRPVVVRLINNPAIENLIMTTRESLTTSGLVTIVASGNSERLMRWLVQGGLPKKFGPFELGDRQMQDDTIFCYDQIPVPVVATVNSRREFVAKLKEAFTQGSNIGVYPEGIVKPREAIFGSKLKPYNQGFEGLIHTLNSINVVYQIQPIGVYFENGQFVVKFGDPIEPILLPREEASRRTILSIAEQLPLPLRGIYDR